MSTQQTTVLCPECGTPSEPSGNDWHCIACEMWFDAAELAPRRNGQRPPRRRVDISALKASVRISAIFQAHGVVPDAAGMAPCPWHEDSTPSLHVNDAEGYFKCHGCDAKGDHFSALGRFDGLDFKAALAELQRMAGELPAVPASKRDKPERVPARFPIPDTAAAALNEKLAHGKVPDGHEGWILISEKYGPAVAGWRWHDRDGNWLFSTARHERDSRKSVLAYFFGEDEKWHLGDVLRENRPLFRLHELAASALPVLIVEGEKCASVDVPGFIVTTWRGGTGAVSQTDFSPLEARAVTIWPDADEPGITAALKIRERLPQARILRIEGREQGWDVADAAAEGIDLAAFIAKASIVEAPETDAQGELAEEIDDAQSEGEEGGRAEVADSGEGKGRGPSQGTRLVKLALEQGMEFFHDDRRLYVGLVVGKHKETWPLRSVSFRDLLSHLYFLNYEKAPGGTALEDAIKTLSGKAQFEGKWEDVFVRVAGDDSRILLDLANDSWEAVEITDEGWRIVSDPGLRFRRTKGMAPLPTPVHGGSLSDLYSFLNTKTPEDLLLILSWLVMAFRPQGPYPVLCLAGEQGSTKSTVARLLRSLVDPSGAALRSSPRTAEEFFISACNSWCLNIDNLSELKDWLSDSICRVASGAGFAKRTLYTDSDEEIYQVQRPVILNGINEVASRGDLLDRSIVITLPAMQEETRKEESEVDADFKAKQPSILGALLDAVSAAMGTLPDIHLQTHPRMADFTRWGCAAAAGLNASKEGFLEAYEANRVDADQLAIESSPIGPVLLEMVEAGRFVIKWTDTPTKLLAILGEQVGARMDKIKEWPKTPKDLTSAVKRLAPHLRRAGIEVDTGRDHKGRWVSIVKVWNGQEDEKA